MIAGRHQYQCDPGRGAGEAGDTGPEYATRPELAVAALIHLLSRYPATRTPALAHAIVAHLRTIGDDARLAPALRDCALGLVGDWQAFALLSDDGPALAPRLHC